MKIEKNQKAWTRIYSAILWQLRVLFTPTPVIPIWGRGSASNLPLTIYRKQLVRPSNEANEVGFFFLRAATERRGFMIRYCSKNPCLLPRCGAQRKQERALLHNPPFYLVPFTWALPLRTPGRNETNSTWKGRQETVLWERGGTCFLPPQWKQLNCKSRAGQRWKSEDREAPSAM